MREAGGAVPAGTLLRVVSPCGVPVCVEPAGGVPVCGVGGGVPAGVVWAPTNGAAEKTESVTKRSSRVGMIQFRSARASGPPRQLTIGRAIACRRSEPASTACVG